MSIVTHSAIAASVSQGALNQSQVARAQDAQRNYAARQAALLKQASEKHLESVEQIDESNDENVIVEDRPQEREAGSHGDQAHAQPSEENAEAEAQPPRVDLTA